MTSRPKASRVWRYHRPQRVPPAWVEPPDALAAAGQEWQWTKLTKPQSSTHRKTTEIDQVEGWWSSLAWPSITILGMILLVVSMVSLVQSIDRRDAVSHRFSSASNSPPVTADLHSPRVTAFEVYLSPSGDAGASEQLVGTSAWEAACGDWMRVTARLDTPAYAYLLSLTAEGQITVVDPPGPGSVPERSEVIAYPRFPQHVARLSQGPGLQGLLLLVSAEPLPAYADWAPGRQLRWPSTQAIGAWRSNGRALERWEPGGPAVSGGVFHPPKSISRLFSASQRLEGVAACELIAFPVRLIKK